MATAGTGTLDDEARMGGRRRSRLRTGDVETERRVTVRAAADGGAPLCVLPSGDAPSAEPPVERVVYAGPAMAGGLALWCTMATLAQQLAAANASQACARHALERNQGRLVRENGRLVAELEDTALVLAIQAEDHARACRRATWLIYGLSLAVVALGALLLVLGPLAAGGRFGA